MIKLPEQPTYIRLKTRKVSSYLGEPAIVVTVRDATEKIQKLFESLAHREQWVIR